MRGITPFLWFEDQAEEAAGFYTGIFPGSRIVSITRYGEAASQASGRPRGSVMTVVFELAGTEFTALNGGPQFTFSPALSLVANCETQEEVDNLWEKLSEGGEPGVCGWLTDRYGVTWQIVPVALTEMLQSDDTAATERMMAAMLQMKKLDIETLQRAFRGEA